MRLKRIFGIFCLVIALSVTGFYFYIRPKYVVPILMYHRIDNQGKSSSLSVSPENFHHQMKFLAKAKYNVISLLEFTQAKEQKQPLARNAVVITFDDGYRDNYLFAYPVLEEFNFPATIFLIVNSIDQEGYLDYSQIKEMLRSGIIDIGSHSLEGDYLPKLAVLQLAQEIGTSKKKLKAELKREIDLFCYPIGGFSAQIQELVKKYGYRAACTTNRGIRQTHLNDDIFALKRIKIKDSANLFVFWVKLSGYYNFFRRVKEPY